MGRGSNQVAVAFRIVHEVVVEEPCDGSICNVEDLFQDEEEDA